MKVGVLGSGEVGRTLASGFLRHGHEVMVGTRDSAKLADWKSGNPKGRVGSFEEAARFGEAIVLAVKGDAGPAVLRLAGVENLSGKVVMDTTNPIASGPPQDGVLRFFTTLEDSLLERLQREFPALRFVKVFSSVGSGLMVNPSLAGGPPSMFICGNDTDARQFVRGVLDQFGWATEDLGLAPAARAIEPLCILWCIPGFRENDWVHAYKVLR